MCYTSSMETTKAERRTSVRIRQDYLETLKNRVPPSNTSHRARVEHALEFFFENGSPRFSVNTLTEFDPMTAQGEPASGAPESTDGNPGTASSGGGGGAAPEGNG